MSPGITASPSMTEAPDSPELDNGTTGITLVPAARPPAAHHHHGRDHAFGSSANRGLSSPRSSTPSMLQERCFQAEQRAKIAEDRLSDVERFANRHRQDFARKLERLEDEKKKLEKRIRQQDQAAEQIEDLQKRLDSALAARRRAEYSSCRGRQMFNSGTSSFGGPGTSGMSSAGLSFGSGATSSYGPAGSRGKQATLDETQRETLRQRLQLLHRKKRAGSDDNTAQGNSRAAAEVVGESRAGGGGGHSQQERVRPNEMHQQHQRPDDFLSGLELKTAADVQAAIAACVVPQRPGGPSFVVTTRNDILEGGGGQNGGTETAVAKAHRTHDSRLFLDQSGSLLSGGSSIEQQPHAFSSASAGNKLDMDVEGRSPSPPLVSEQAFSSESQMGVRIGSGGDKIGASRMRRKAGLPDCFHSIASNGSTQQVINNRLYSPRAQQIVTPPQRTRNLANFSNTMSFSSYRQKMMGNTVNRKRKYAKHAHDVDVGEPGCSFNEDEDKENQEIIVEPPPSGPGASRAQQKRELQHQDTAPTTTLYGHHSSRGAQLRSCSNKATFSAFQQGTSYMGAATFASSTKRHRSACSRDPSPSSPFFCASATSFVSKSRNGWASSSASFRSGSSTKKRPWLPIGNTSSPAVSPLSSPRGVFGNIVRQGLVNVPPKPTLHSAHHLWG
ncbi:unnamed protein product [Amoebophrya sp. A25]|nr:unnamed protein product [Amoebophrya sp. A25]|eukprot:GSA25T00009997001.1